MQYGILLISVLIKVAIEPGNFQTEYADGLKGRVRRVYQRADHIEKSFYTKLAAYRGYGFHRRVKERGMEKADVGGIQLSIDFALVIGKDVAKVFNHVG